MPNKAKAQLLKAAESWAAQRLDSAWVLSEDDRIALQRAAPNASVFQQPGYGFGCDLERFDPDRISSAERRSLMAQVGLKDEHRVLTFVGRYVDFKGFDLVVRAFLKLAPSNPGARLLLIGARDPLHPTGLSQTEEAEWRHSPQIIDVGWTTHVERYLALSYVVVFPSQREGMPVSLMEALAMGVPVITLNSRWVPRSRTGSTGRLCFEAEYGRKLDRGDATGAGQTRSTQVYERAGIRWPRAV